MEIIGIVNKKGGVAKTTTALALVSGLAKRKFRVLAIDCDAQANFSKASNGEVVILYFSRVINLYIINVEHS